LSFVNFQGKLTGTSWNLLACEASLFGLLCAWRKVQILRQHVCVSLFAKENGFSPGCLGDPYAQ
jgi:hypothetical protein